MGGNRPWDVSAIVGCNEREMSCLLTAVGSWTFSVELEFVDAKRVETRYRSTPTLQSQSLRVAGTEDDDEDENEGPSYRTKVPLSGSARVMYFYSLCAWDFT